MVPIFFSYLYVLEPVIDKITASGASLTSIGSAFEIVGAILVGTMSLYTLLISQNPNLTYIAFGFFGFAIIEWGINFELINKDTLQFSFYDLLWFHSILMIWVGLRMSPEERIEIQSPNFSRMSDLLSVYQLALAAIPTTLIATTMQSASANVAIIIFIFYSFLFLVVLIKHFIRQQLTHYSNILALASDNDHSSFEMNRALEDLPAELIGLAHQVSEVSSKIQKNELQHRSKLFAQVAHDIRSPLAALEILSSHLDTLPEGTRLILRNSINRIRDIAVSLGERETVTTRHGNGSESFHVETEVHIDALIETLVAEKRVQYGIHKNIFIDFQYSESSYGIFAKIDPVEIARAISNLIDNAVEALEKKGGNVDIIIRRAQDLPLFQIQVKDNGKGINNSLIKDLGQRGRSYGKPGGSGLGLHHAKNAIESFGGNLEIDSVEGEGTTVTISLPRSDAPAWFVPKIILFNNQDIITVDDDENIHGVWKERLSESGASLHSFSTFKGITDYYRTHFSDLHEHTLFLVDYEIVGEADTGLDLISKLGVETISILVTSRYEDPEIRRRCDKMGIKMIPKGLCAFVPVETLNEKDRKTAQQAPLSS